MEEWRPIKGHETEYAVSNLGRIKNLERTIRCGTGVRRIPERVLKLEEHYRGYLRVMIGRQHLFVHRIVAVMWLAEAHTTDVVNHKNGDKTDNRVENLEWATFKENTQHYHQFLRPEAVPQAPVDDYEFKPEDLPF